MKRAVAFLLAGALLIVGSSAFAQTQPAQPAQSAQPTQPPSAQQGYAKDAYVKNIPCFKILVYRLGYEVLYFKGDMSIGRIYVPLTWFNGGAKAVAYITYGNGPQLPYVSIAWVDGKFDHVTINALEDMQGPTWGQIDPSVDLTSQFNIQEPPREF